MSKLVELQQRLAQIDAERPTLVRLIEAWQAYESVIGTPSTGADNVIPRQRERSAGVTRPSPTMSATEEAVAALLEERGPLGTGDLVVSLRSVEGVNLPLERATNVLSARLSNSKKFIGRRGYGWWFSDRPWPYENGASQGNVFDAPETAEQAQ
jgi:hypothetical protein